MRPSFISRRPAGLVALALAVAFVLASTTASPAATKRTTTRRAATTKATAKPATPTTSPAPAPTTAVATTVASRPRSGGTVVWGARFVDSTAANLLSAFRNPPAYPSVLSFTLYDGLTKLDPTKGFAPVPSLAQSWTISADKLTYTFKLRSDVKWHDGKAFTAKDVKFTFDAIRERKYAATTSSSFSAVKEVVVDNDTTLRVVLSRPYAPFLDSAALPILPEHLLAPELAAGKLPQNTDLARKPVGTGPFTFVSASSSEIVLEANKNYWGGVPGVDRIVLAGAADDAAIAARLLAGELDGGDISPVIAKRIDGDRRYDVVANPSASVYAFTLNTNHPLLKDPNVRIALNTAIDRSALVSSLAAGKGVAANSPLIETAWNTTPKDVFAFDQNKVATLMQGAGWKRDSSGVWAKDGKQFVLTMFDYFIPDAAQIVKSQLEQAGFDVQLTTGRSFNDFYGKISADPNSVMAAAYTFGSPSDADGVYFLFHSSATFDKGGFNAHGYRNADVDRALDAARTETDQAARARAYSDFQTAVAKDPAYLLLYTADLQTALSTKLVGVDRKMAVGQSSAWLFWNAKDWTKQK